MNKETMEKATILVANNDPKFLEDVKEYLEYHGYAVITAANTIETRQALEQEQIDLAVLDLRLTTNEDEKDITGLILAKTANPDISKIILTSFPTYEAVREALGTALTGLPAAVAFVTKQEGLEALLTTVRSALEIAESEEERGATPKFALWWIQRRPLIALSALLLALGTGILAMVYGDPKWLLGTILLAVLAVLLIGVPME